MKSRIIYLFLCVWIGIFSFSGCSDFGDINIDPNNPSQADTRFLFARAMQGVTSAVFTSAPAPNTSTYDPFSQLYPQYLAEAQNIQYTEFGIVDFNMGIYYYTFLRNLQLIIAMNQDEKQKATEFVVGMGSNANQIAAAKTLEAFYYMHMTDVVGMIYFSEALQGDQGNFTPKFDSQKDIYTALDERLNEAYAMFNEKETFDATYDLLYGGKIAKWKQLNASLRMLMAIKLSDVEPETGKARFIKAYNDGGIKTNESNLRYHYLNETANMNPLHDNMEVSKRKDFAPAKTIIDALIAHKDPRALSYGIPNPQGKYDAVPFGVARANISAYKGKIVMLNPKVYAMDATVTIISAARMLLIEAEAAVREWITADAAELYKKAITESFAEKDFKSDIAQYENSNPELLKKLQDEYGFITNVDEYVAQANVALTGTMEEKIAKIGMQRWMNGFMEDGIEAWSDWRRLNVPKLTPGEAAAGTIKHVPYRRYYHLGDYEVNKENYDAAIAAQGPDNFETRVWWDTKDND